MRARFCARERECTKEAEKSTEARGGGGREKAQEANNAPRINDERRAVSSPVRSSGGFMSIFFTSATLRIAAMRSRAAGAICSNADRLSTTRTTPERPATAVAMRAASASVAAITAASPRQSPATSSPMRVPCRALSMQLSRVGLVRPLGAAASSEMVSMSCAPSSSASSGIAAPEAARPSCSSDSFATGVVGLSVAAAPPLSSSAGSSGA